MTLFHSASVIAISVVSVYFLDDELHKKSGGAGFEPTPTSNFGFNLLSHVVLITPLSHKNSPPLRVNKVKVLPMVITHLLIQCTREQVFQHITIGHVTSN